MNKKRIILSTKLTDLMKLRIAVDSHSKCERVNKSSDKNITYAGPEKTLRKVLKKRHK